ncbi:hypothetical protein [Mycolicibacterium sp. CR10]|uniref:hypothetical protein n=1 Tax=Mycolicibacterium sp. CR10 TaxID=2562314 RepID=UPI0010C037E3|nr:hypothetical protein [Mycolicibacterium sp. CR10]
MTPNRSGEGAHALPPDRIPGATGHALSIANEFAEVVVRRVDTRNGARLLIQSPKSGRWVSLDALEAEALTWQNPATLAAMVGNANAPLILGDDA